MSAGAVEDRTDKAGTIGFHWIGIWGLLLLHGHRAISRATQIKYTMTVKEVDKA
jgi:hypothetical protein